MSDKPHPHKFRYLLPPGNNFAFVAKFKIWIWISIALMAVAIGSLFVNKSVRGEYMNWTTDFKGGTQIIVSFKDKAGNYIKEDPATVRKAFADAHEPDVELSDISYAQSTPKGDVQVNGMIIVSPRFSALTEQQRAKATADFMAAFKDRDVGKATWSGDRMFVRAKKVIQHDEAISVFKNDGLELKPWTDDEAAQYPHADEGTGEFNEVFSIWGVDRQYEKLLEASLGNGTNVTVEQSYGVGAKAGDKLKDDAAKSIIYALFLIMLYLAFRFDVRYAPGAAFATIHDAVMVIGVFSLTWTPVSLVSVGRSIASSTRFHGSSPRTG